MSRRYINHFFSLKCASDVIGFFIGCKERAAKEVTESMSMWWAIKERLDIDPADATVTCIVVGDGAMPRAGGLISHMSQWLVYSVDPNFNLKNIGWLYGCRARANAHVRRLKIRRRKIESVQIDCKGGRCVVVMPHSHAPMKEAVQSPFNYSRLDIVALPCCEPIPDRFKATAEVFYDVAIWSPKNVMHIWKDLKVKAIA